MKTTRHVLIHGRVQGVGYRESMRRGAQTLGCTGWVCNRRDGCVEAVVQGPAEAVEALLAWAHRGPPAARVDAIDSNEAQGSYEQFEIRPGG